MRNNANKQFTDKAIRDYSYYSNTLKAPFDSIEELREAEAAYHAKIAEKENKAAVKKADAAKVEDAFRALNATRKTYKEKLAACTAAYSEDLKKLKAAFESEKQTIQAELATAEADYAAKLKAFTDKYPEGYHLTLKDGDFETTIAGHAVNGDTKSAKAVSDLFDMFDLFRWL